MTIAESIHLNKEQIARAFGVPAHMLADPDRTAVPRYWSLCMSSENHGTVGPAGCKFSHAPEKHERVLVVEVPAAAGAPADQINLRLVGARKDLPVAEFEGYVDGEPLVRWMDRDNMPRVGTKLFAGAQAVDSAGDLANEASGQETVDRVLRAAQAWANEEYMCGRRMGKGEPAMSDRAEAAKSECVAAILALPAPVAAQAGQVAVPEEELARFCPACGSVGEVGPGYRDCCPDGSEARLIPKRLAEKCHELFKVALSTMRAAAPASPAQAAPLPTPYISINENIQFQHLLLDAMIGAKNGSIATTHSEKIKALTDFIDAAMQASTSGERQEGGAA